MYTLEMLKALAPFAGALCFENFVYRQGDFCNFRDHRPSVVRYGKPNPDPTSLKDPKVLYTDKQLALKPSTRDKQNVSCQLLVCINMCERDI